MMPFQRNTVAAVILPFQKHGGGVLYVGIACSFYVARRIKNTWRKLNKCFKTKLETNVVIFGGVIFGACVFYAISMAYVQPDVCFMKRK